MPSIKIDVLNGKRIPSAKALPISIMFEPTNTILNVKQTVHRQFPRLPVERQKLSLSDRTTPEDDRLVGDLPDATLYLKDLGPQISWRTVFLVEYVGPLIIAPIFYHVPQIYGLVSNARFEHSEMQRLVYALVLAHYLKRELETIFVHRFSHATMPAFNIVKNSAYYWGLSGLLLAGSAFGPWYSQGNLRGTLRDNPIYLGSLTCIWAVAELSNFITHWTLRNLRTPGTRERAIPKGYGFKWITCPNYTFEIIAWLAILAMTWDPAVGLFYAVGVNQMTRWAIKKHKNYKKEFGQKYPRRWVIFPFLL